MSDPRTRAEPSGWQADGHVAAAVCLGVWLLAGTALSAVMASGPPFSAVAPPDAAAERGDGTHEGRGWRPAAGAKAAGADAATPEAARESWPPQPLDINRADAEALRTLPGVGPALARQIVNYRETHGPFRSPADLLQVSGVGAKRFGRLQGLIRAAEAP